MGEKKSKKERTLVINIKLTRGLVGVLIATLLAVAFVGYLALGQKRASASPATVPETSAAAASSGLRKYYMSAINYQGNLQATAVCITGYHMASLWEIVDPSNLEYATDLIASGTAKSCDDVGQGPPASYVGWVRTGYDNSPTGPAGQANCDGWSSANSGHYGTTAALPPDWAAGADIDAWEFGTLTCNDALPVWCVED